MTTPQPDTQKTEALVGRLFSSALGALDLLGVYIGDRLGFYKALAMSGPLTSAQLAKKASVAERYAREWLEQQAVTGFLEVSDATQPSGTRKYSLPPAHAVALTEPESPFSMAPMSRFVVASGKIMPKLLSAYRTGGGVPWSAYGPDAFEAQGDFNRPWLVNQLGTEYFPAILDIHARLQADPPAKVADVCCGVGWAGIALARAYPKITVHGIDLDSKSITQARKNAAHAGLTKRVKFDMQNAADPSLKGAYDLAIVVEAIHDLSKPVEVLKAVRGMLKKNGTAIIVDEKVGDTFKAPSDDIERLMYGASILFCLPNGMAEQPPAATGTVMRTSIFRSYAAKAGFKKVEVLGLEHPFFRFYRLDH